ncbi:MAG: oligosaccharide repeat unit polymerase [Bacteroidetes bacterium]|nr:oligosaccharide repeat unit polymerase [Bacteroidota bacterium]MCW5895358.1 oligosaccharide repeat unit polymerase [Bacteroidota bacterium]
MSWVSVVCFAVCAGILVSFLKRGSDILSPGRLFGFIWCLSIGLTELKFSALQHEWRIEGWVLLLTGVGAFLIGIFGAFVLNLDKRLVPISEMRQSLRREKVRERLLFLLICIAVAAYAISYLVIFLAKGWLPIFVVGTKTSRVEFNVIGFTVLLYSAGFIVFFTLLYTLLVPDQKRRKAVLIVLSVLTMGSYFLLLQRFQVIMAAVMCLTFLYYATHHIRVRTVVPLLMAVTGFFYWIMSLRLGSLVASYTYWVSKMTIPIDFAFITEPYMYIVTNMENFARSVHLLDHHTFGYFTFDFIVSITGLEGWSAQYFNIDRTPYITSYYNTYTAFWPFYRDFGVIGLAVVPLILGFVSGTLYYKMRIAPSIKSVTAYSVMVFVMLISFFVFPISFLWFQYNLLAMYWILRLTMVPSMGTPSTTSVGS